MVRLCASLLAANHAFLAKEMLEAERCGIDYFHFDVSDGHYAKYLLFGNQVVSQLRELTTSYFDVHLAVHNLESILETFLDSGASLINLQYDTAKEKMERLIKRVEEAHLEASITFTPENGFEEIEPLLGRTKSVNLLAVNPGIGGQQLNAVVLKKAERCANYIAQNNLSTTISVDGGINRETIRSVVSTGADIAIIGSGIFCGSIEKNIEELRSLI